MKIKTVVVEREAEDTVDGLARKMLVLAAEMNCMVLAWVEDRSIAAEPGMSHQQIYKYFVDQHEADIKIVSEHHSQSALNPEGKDAA